MTNKLLLVFKKLSKDLFESHLPEITGLNYIIRRSLKMGSLFIYWSYLKLFN